MSKLWGIDLGGTKIEGVILKSKDDPEVLIRERIPSEVSKGYEHIQNQVKILVDSLKDNIGESPVKIGIGTPGSIEPDTGLLKNSNSTALNQKPFLKDIQSKLGVEISMANDANCFALAEANMGAANKVDPNASVVFGVIMGTGVGGGVVVEGRPINGHQGIGGEWGHNFLDASGGKCYCGKEGCVETIIAGPSLERYYESISGEHRKLKDIYERYLAGNDSSSDKTIKRLMHFFGLGLSNVVNILDPDVIVIGGGVGNIDLLYTEGVEAMGEFVFNPSFNTKIVKPILGDSAGVFGAAFLVA